MKEDVPTIEPRKEDLPRVNFEQGRQLGLYQAFKEIFEKFDKFACIKDDKWYLDFKKTKLNNQTNHED